MIKKFNEDLLRLSGLLKENIEEQPNIPTYREFYIHMPKYLREFKNKSPDLAIKFAKECAKKVLPIWENWVKNRTDLTDEQKLLPREAFKLTKPNNSIYDKIMSLIKVVENISNELFNYHINTNNNFDHPDAENAGRASEAAKLIAHIPHASYDDNIIAIAYGARNLQVVRDSDIYEIYTKLILDYHKNPIKSQHITSTVKNLAKQQYQDKEGNNIPILADALEDTGYNNDKVLTHLRSHQEKGNNHWILNNILTAKDKKELKN